MSLDKTVAERRRFARLLGIDDAVGSGLPIGSTPDSDDERDDDSDRPRSGLADRGGDPDRDTA